MKGAIVLLAVFIIFIGISLAYHDMPPRGPIYTMLNLPTTDYPVLGIPATTLIIAVFYGVIFGIIAWATYTILEKRGMLK